MTSISVKSNFKVGPDGIITITFPTQLSRSNYKIYIDGAEITGLWDGSCFILGKWKGINPNPEKEQIIKDVFNLFNGKVNNLSDEDISLYMMLTNKDKETTLSDIKKFQSYVNKAREENKLYGRESWKRRY